MKKILLLIPMLLAFVSCVSPDTQPVIDGALEWKKAEDEELERHKQLASVAKFDEDPVKNAEAKARYGAALDRHARIVDNYANAIISWAQRVGEFDEDYANKTLDQMVNLYLQLREAERNR